MRIKANYVYWCDVLKGQFKLPSYKFQSDRKKNNFNGVETSFRRAT